VIKSKDERGWVCSRHDTWEIHTKFWAENLKGGDCFEHLGIDGKIILKWILEKQVGKLWTGFIWLRIGTCGGLL
jgi:hypothetical protein